MNGEFAAFIEARRKEQNLTKSALADKAGLSRQALYKIVQGDVKQTYLDTIIKLAIPLKVHPVILIQKLFKQSEFPAMESKRALCPKDATGFISDITYPDNSIVKAGQEFKKIWRLQNLGKQVWENRFLKCFDTELQISTRNSDMGLLGHGRGLIPKSRKISVPLARPEEIVDLAVCFTAPDYPCTVISYWKMVDKDDKICFPQIEGLSCLVKVI